MGKRINKLEDITRTKWFGYNKEYREQIAKRLGYTTDYVQNYVTGATNTFEKINFAKGIIQHELTKDEKKVTANKPTIHEVVILDNSGSMYGDKFNNAYQGVKDEVEMLKADNSVNYKYSLFNFDNSKPTLQINCQSIKLVGIKPMNTNNGTPLYDTIVAAYEHIKEKLVKDTKVLLKVITDGCDEHSKGGISIAKASITTLKSLGITTTFIGTKEDVAFIVKQLAIDVSNTLVHDNTSEGIKETFIKINAATKEYSKKIVAGEDVSTGFFMKFN